MKTEEMWRTGQTMTSPINRKDKQMEANNCQKMREALMQIRDSVYIDPDGNECHSDIDASDLREICDAALSAPPRNCDLYATVDEAFDDYLKAMEETPREAQVFIEMWLLSEAKGEAK